MTRPDGTDVYPCNDADPTKVLEKIDYTCPEDSKCLFHSNDSEGYVCLNVQKKTSAKGNNYEIQVIVNRNNTKDYKILCSDKNTDITTPEGISDSICKKDHSGSAYTDCNW